MEFDGSASVDPDASVGDRIVAYHWTFTSVDAACPSPTVVATDPKALVRFECGGAFRVTLVAVDERGKESEPTSADVGVTPVDVPLIVSPDQIVNHRCSGSPQVCTTEGGDPVLDAYLAPGIDTVGTVAFHWSVSPAKADTLDSHQRVVFSPSADVPSPSVHIEVDNASISVLVSDWPLEVSVRDDMGELARATTRISVTNRAPVLVAEAKTASVGHVYSGGLYYASADTSKWADPDGDPLGQGASSTGSAVCPTYSFKSDGTAVVECKRACTGTPALSGFVATHAISVQPSDPWQTASAPSTTAVTVRNTAVSTSDSTSRVSGGTCQPECCRWEKDPETHLPECVEQTSTCTGYSTSVPLGISDADGDPVSVTWNGGTWGTARSPCKPGQCNLGVYIGSRGGCGHDLFGTLAGSFTVTDGLTTSSAMLTVNY